VPGWLETVRGFLQASGPRYPPVMVLSRGDVRPEVSHRYVEARGLRMHIAEAGTGPLVLLHGFPECWYSWRHQLAALAEAGYHAVAPDQRGYCRTGGPEAVPALFIAGDRDLVISGPGTREMLPRLRDVAPRLREPVLLSGCGHWTQQERPDEVSKAMIGFIRELD
jgi:pimeloyl-ACP methyl ester carboxylesterase